MKLPKTDHLGNEFPSVNKLCTHYDVSVYTFRDRMEKGYSLERALTERSKSTACKDHLGNEFPSVVDMCRFHKIKPMTFKTRMKNGWTLKKALTEPLVTKPGTPISCEDHLGNGFRSVNAMCAYYGIPPSRYRNRISSGWTQEDALTTPVEDISSKQASLCEDGMHDDGTGRRFDTIKEMCDFHKVSRATYKARIRNGMSVADALGQVDPFACMDPYGQKFDTVRDMCDYYGSKDYEYVAHIHKRNRYYLAVALKLVPNLKSNIRNIAATDDLTLIEGVDRYNHYILCNYEQHEIVLTKEQITDICLNAQKEKWILKPA